MLKKMKKKLKQARELNKAASKTIIDAAKGKIKDSKADHRIPVLFLLEFFLSVAIAVAIYYYIDPQKNVMPFPFNVVVFVLLLAAFLWIYQYTSEFRVYRKEAKAQR